MAKLKPTPKDTEGAPLEAGAITPPPTDQVDGVSEGGSDAALASDSATSAAAAEAALVEIARPPILPDEVIWSKMSWAEREEAGGDRALVEVARLVGVKPDEVFDFRAWPKGLSVVTTAGQKIQIAFGGGDE
ncbi:hypothetical protein [Zavarzinia aquatilis]|uniref:Uncharacterized protein n=1 Tax=Zavarzinia aquatilis TaxID=2211142 RepID=A0A317DSP4_9PROT|nr:hypothetical protein [Zavarzinia aquatilis]PWR17681.1 hypothetical protein DKG74_20550 [Zavarzinia aquatilis]